ncbi:hypothetical protein WN944_024712 [Citrus x changshan-huyou]|uniref:Uncharacterized protein n=1 Tax=Citrus x changshan-huyou TaxID=2935761 RepID=A0AAP0LPE6_9ROSI
MKQRNFIRVSYLLFLLVAYTRAAVFGEADSRCIERERQALLIFKQGNISSSLLVLEHFYYLHLSGNDFGGTQILEFIASLTKLRILDLSDANFGGRIPYQLGNLADLQSINIGLSAIRVRKFDQELDLSSSAPPKINYRFHSLVNSSPSSPTQLHLSLCGLSNSAYHCLSHISKSLVYLDFSNNQLQGPTPDYAFRNMTSLASLTSLNYITGISKFSLPITLVRPKYAFSNVTSLIDLDLSKNQITGIPKSFGDMCSLKTLKIHDNNHTAKLPELFLNFSAGCAKKSLQSFMLQNNMLSGSLPGVTEFSSLKELDISNRLNGTFPKQFCRPSSLVELDLESSQLWVPLLGSLVLGSID